MLYNNKAVVLLSYVQEPPSEPLRAGFRGNVEYEQKMKQYKVRILMGQPNYILYIWRPYI